MPDAEIFLRLAVSLLAGALVGVERQWHHKNAGIKTHALVALGAASFGLVSVLGLGPNSAPTQLAVGVVTGIGFIGGGVIMRRAGGVQGITTAATLWTTASLGLAMGGGYYAVAAVVFAGMLIVQIPMRRLDAWIDTRSDPGPRTSTYRLSVTFIVGAEDSVRSAWAAFAVQEGVAFIACDEVRQGGNVVLEGLWSLWNTRVVQLAAFAKSLAQVQGVTRVAWSQVSTPERE